MQAGNSLLVAVGDGNILGVGAVTDAGQINLLYVSPDARFRGISKALLLALEQRAASRGCTACTLRSSETARRATLRYRCRPQTAKRLSDGGPIPGDMK